MALSTSEDFSFPLRTHFCSARESNCHPCLGGVNLDVLYQAHATHHSLFAMPYRRRSPSSCPCQSCLLRWARFPPACHCSCIPRLLVYVAPSTISRYLDFFSFLHQPNAPLLSFVRSFPRFVVGVLIVNLYRPTHPLQHRTPLSSNRTVHALRVGYGSILWSATGPFSRGKLGRLCEGITGAEWSLVRLSALQGL